VAKHIQLPVGAGIRLGIIIRAFVILIKVHYKQERTQYYNIRWNSGFGWADGCLGTRLLVRQELMTNQYFIGIDTDK
jgi:hypothetical protein